MAFRDLTTSGGSTANPGNPGQLSPTAPGFNTGTNADANTVGAGGFNNPYAIDPHGSFNAITGELRAANRASRARIDSQTAGQVESARDFGQRSQNFARARLAKIGGFEGTYGIGLQNSIAARTEKNIQGINRAGEEAKAAGDMELSGRLAELGLQQMTLLAQLNAQAFEQTKFRIGNERQDARNLVLDERADREFELAEEEARQRGFETTQLDNGDFGYWDYTGDEPKFVKQGNARKPLSGTPKDEAVSYDVALNNNAKRLADMGTNLGGSAHKQAVLYLLAEGGFVPDATTGDYTPEDYGIVTSDLNNAINRNRLDQPDEEEQQIINERASAFDSNFDSFYRGSSNTGGATTASFLR